MRDADRGFFGHPIALSTLFFTEMWERFSYYGMRAILILFMVAPVTEGGLGMPVPQAGAIQGTYTAMVYMMTMVGGWFADKLLGLRRSVFWGGVLIMAGHLSLAVPGLATFYLGLLLVVLGTGLLKGNVSAIVGQLYRADDTRRDAGYSLYYMGVNLGGFLGPLFCGYFAQAESFRRYLAGIGLTPETGWHFGFGAAAVGMFAGLVQYQLGRRRLPASTEAPLGVTNPEEAARARRQLARVGGTVVVAALVALGLDRSGAIAITPTGFAAAVDAFLVVLVVGFFGWLLSAKHWTAVERRQLVVVFVLFLGAAVFWAGFEQAASTLNLFATRNPSSPAKFTLGLLFLSLAYVLMVVAALRAGAGDKVSPLWLIGCYFLQTIGELCLSPVGLSAMSTLAPARVQGLMMGVWFLASSVGNKVAGRVGGLYESYSLPTIFGANALFVLIFAVVMALLVVPIKRMLARAQT
jgi:POT family proton-dependent oligopeptide transporter